MQFIVEFPKVCRQYCPVSIGRIHVDGMAKGDGRGAPVHHDNNIPNEHTVRILLVFIVKRRKR